MDPEELARLLRDTAETQERIAGLLAGLNAQPSAATTLIAAAATPVIAQGVTDQAIGDPRPSRRLLTASDRIELQTELRKKSTPQLHMLFAEQARQMGTGIPLDAWLASGGQARVAAFQNGVDSALDPMVVKALDSAGASALIRQDLEPVLLELFIRTFPAWERITKEPANGLTHTYQQITDFGDAQFMSELGTVTDDKSTYVRKTTNIAIVATRRGISLKSQFAAVQSGAGFNPEQLELTGGLRAIARKMQRQIFSGSSTDSGGTADNELGKYDADGFDGLRMKLNQPTAKNVDPLGDSPEDMRRAWNQGAVEVMQAGGVVTMIYLSPLDKEVFDAAQDKNVRYTNDLVNVGVGVNTNVVNTVFGAMPLFPIPGDAIGPYHPDGNPFSGDRARDSYLLDESTITAPYLGSEGPTVLDIPIGISGQLSHLYIIFGMWGLAVKALIFNNKVRINTGE